VPQDQPDRRLRSVPPDSPPVPAGLQAQPERRVARVQLAQLEVLDLLALLGLPAPGARLDPPGLLVFRVYPARWDQWDR